MSEEKVAGGGDNDIEGFWGHFMPKYQAFPRWKIADDQLWSELSALANDEHAAALSPPPLPAVLRLKRVEQHQDVMPQATCTVTPRIPPHHIMYIPGWRYASMLYGFPKISLSMTKESLAFKSSGKIPTYSDHSLLPEYHRPALHPSLKSRMVCRKSLFDPCSRIIRPLGHTVTI